MLRTRLIMRILGALLLIVGVAMAIPWAIAFFSTQGQHAYFLWPMLGSVVSGLLLFLLFPSAKNDEISHREAFLIVTVGWIVVAAAAAFPFWIFSQTVSGAGKYFPTFTAAYFESMSGLTTTGATILPSIQELPQSILFWRCLTHWLGGMGIILLGIAILPLLGIGGMQLFRAEVPGPTADKIRPRIKETAKSLWRVYILLTVVETVFLMFGGMSLFDAICHSFSTVATGGFSTKNISVEAYHSVYIEVVITVFMVLAGTNFALHFFSLRGKLREVWKDEEFRFYSFVTVFWSIVIAFALYGSGYYNGFFQSLRYSSFQVVSLLTSTGFSSWNFDDWWVDAARQGANLSFFAANWLVLLMFIGGCAGSTGGGVKCVRVWLLVKIGFRELIRLLHPRMVKPVKINNQSVPENVLFSITGFFALYLLITGLCTLVLTYFQMDLLSAFTAVAACIGNIGPGLAKVGPYQNFSAIPSVGKWMLIFCMLLGRLELYTVMVILIPQFWRR